jgi:hypothetical protein
MNYGNTAGLKRFMKAREVDKDSEDFRISQGSRTLDENIRPQKYHDASGGFQQCGALNLSIRLIWDKKALR